MNTRTLRRIGIIGLILTLLVGLDGMYMLATNYKPDDAGSNTLHMTDGTTVLIAAALLLIVSIIAFVMASQAAKREVTSDTVGVTPTRVATAGAGVNDEVVVNDETGTSDATRDATRPEIQR